MKAPAPTSPREVIDGVERKLRDLWNEPVKPGQVPRSRVCTMNLVIVTGSEAVADRYVAVVDEVTRSIPARAIIVALVPEAKESGLSANVSAVCALEGSLDTCSERIQLIAHGTYCDRMGSAVNALLVPELPTALVWLSRVHVEDPVFLDLAKEAQRIVLDTEYTSLTSLLQIARWAREEPGRPHVADLAWTRLAPWQEMCARFFDEPALRDHALAIRHVEVSQASETGAPLGSEGALILGWFATRLGWRVRHVGGSLRFTRADGGSVTVALGTVPRPNGVAPAALARIALEAEYNGVIAKGSLVRELASGLTNPPPPPDDSPPSAARRGMTTDADVLVWRLDVAIPSATEQRVRLGANRGARLLERTLHRPPNDPALNESVAFAEQLLEDGLVCQ